MGLMQSLQRGASSLPRWPIVGPLALRRAKREFVANRERNLFLGVYESWSEAEAAAIGHGATGYDNPESANLYLTRTRIDQHDYPALYWLYRSLHEGHRTVFDVGGSTGIKYFAFREALSPWPELMWTVQDVAAMVRRGRELLASDPAIANLKFTERFEDGSGTDILYASGVLQYLPAPLGEMLAGFRALPRRIIINTAAIHPSRDYFTVNSIGTAFCPYRVQTQASLVRGLGKLGYRMKEGWTNPDKLLTIPFDPEHSLGNYSGYALDLDR